MIKQNTVYINPTKIDRKWHIIDAENKIMGKVAVAAATLVRGKHKAYFTPHQEVGDYVIIINADKVAISGNKATDKKYYRHSGYPGSLKEENYTQLNTRKPGFPLALAIKRMLPKNKLGDKIFTNVKIYAGTTHPHASQKPTEFKI